MGLCMQCGTEQASIGLLCTVCVEANKSKKRKPAPLEGGDEIGTADEIERSNDGISPAGNESVDAEASVPYADPGGLIEQLLAPIRVLFSPRNTFFSLSPYEVGAGAFVAPVLISLGRSMAALVGGKVIGPPFLLIFTGIIAAVIGTGIAAALWMILPRLVGRSLSYRATLTVLGISSTPSILAIPVLILSSAGVTSGPGFLFFLVLAGIGAMWSIILLLYGLVVTPDSEDALPPEPATVLFVFGMVLVFSVVLVILGSRLVSSGVFKKLSESNAMEHLLHRSEDRN